MLDQVNTIHCGDALSILKQMPSEFVDCVVSSPPYWGLRDYSACSCRMKRSAKQESSSLAGDGNATPSHNITPDPDCKICNGTGKICTDIVWDEKEGCEHEWGYESLKSINLQSGNIEFQRDWREKASNATASNGSFCQKCNAWKGSLGLEPSFEMYIRHLCNIFDEIKRVLKKTGTVWLNLGDTYAGSGNGTNDYRTEESKSISGKRFDYNQIFQGKQKSQYQTLPSKSLCMIPYRVAIEMCNTNWILRKDLTSEELSFVIGELIKRGIVNQL